MLTNEYKCFAIGRKEYGRLGIGEAENDIETLVPIEILNDKKIIQLSCGESCSFAVTDDGKVFAWGFGSNNQLGTGSDEDSLEPTLLTGKTIISASTISFVTKASINSFRKNLFA